MPSSTEDEVMMDQALDNNDSLEFTTLVHMKNAWNRLDQNSARGYISVTKRQQYIKDMGQLRQGQQAYYSLGGDDRLEFGRLFSSLQQSRVLQESFLMCASQCVQQNRIMTDGDVQTIILQQKGKRDAGAGPCLEELHHADRPSKRARESYFWLQGIHCFN